MSLWCKRNHYPPRCICITHIWSHTLFPRGIIIFQGVLAKFPHLEKIVHLMKDLKYEYQSTFPMWGRVTLNFRDRYRKLNIFSKNSSHYQKKSLPTQMDLYDPYVVPYTIPLGYYNFSRSTNKFNFFAKFPHLEKICQFNEIPKI